MEYTAAATATATTTPSVPDKAHDERVLPVERLAHPAQGPLFGAVLVLGRGSAARWGAPRVRLSASARSRVGLSGISHGPFKADRTPPRAATAAMVGVEERHAEPELPGNRGTELGPATRRRAQAGFSSAGAGERPKGRPAQPERADAGLRVAHVHRARAQRDDGRGAVASPWLPITLHSCQLAVCHTGWSPFTSPERSSFASAVAA